MSTKVFKYILNFQADAQKFGQQIGGVGGMLKGAAVAAGALFAADKVIDAAKAVADYAQEISGVKSQVEGLMGLQGAAADQMTGNVQALASSYDQDVTEALKAANVLMRNFGETSQSSFDLINAGLSGVANANDDFLKQITEYSTHFREAGANATEMYAVIAEGNKMGVFDDKAADAIKEGSIRLREMTNSTRTALDAIGLSSTQIEQQINAGTLSMFDAMKLVSAQLSKMPQQGAATGAALADIFGGPGEDAVEFIRSLHQIDTSAEAMAAGLTDAQQAQMALTEEMAEFHTIGAQVFGGTNSLITSVKATMMGWVNDAITGIVDLANYFIDLYNESMVFRAGVEYIKFTVQTTFKAVGLVIDQFWNSLKSTGKLIKAVFTGNFKEIPNIIKENFQTTVNNAKEFGQNTADRFTAGVENVLNPRKKIKLISLNTDAEPAGLADGKSYAKGFSKGYAGHAIADVPELMETDKGGEQISVSLGKDELKAFDQAKTQLADMNGFIAENVEYVESMNQSWQGYIEKMWMVGEANAYVNGGLTQMQQAGMAMAENFMAMAASAEVSLDNLGSSVANTVTDIIRAYIAEGVAGAVSKALGSLPFPLNVIAGGVAATAATALFNSVIPKFADGGIVYGPTLGLMGEYPGASTNPEIITPLDKLQKLIQPQRGFTGNLRQELRRDKLVTWIEEGKTELARMT